MFRDWAVFIVQALLEAVVSADPEWDLVHPEDQGVQRRAYRAKMLTLAELSFAFSPELVPREDDGWQAVGIAVAFHLGRIVCFPEATLTRPSSPRPNIDDCQRFQLHTWFHPYTLTPHRGAIYSGDWFGGWRTPDGKLWVLLADVTGHGLGGYLVASGLPNLWAHYWESAPATPEDPLGVLAWLDDKLNGPLPDSVYVEATVATFAPNGEVALALVQNRVIIRRAAEATGTWDVIRTNQRAPWLGLGIFAPDPKDVLTVQLSGGDEVLLTTDGLYTMLGEALVSQLLTQAVARPLRDVVGDLVPVALVAPENRDDLTVIVTRYQGS